MTPLRNQQHIDELKEPWSGRVVTDLFPEELGQAKRRTTTSAHTEQASEHNKEQCDIGNEHGDEVEVGALSVQRLTGVLRRYPY
jgi:hypothetical protein